MTKFYRAGVGDINLTINQRDLSLIRNSSLCIKQLPKNPAFELALLWEKNKKKRKNKKQPSPQLAVITVKCKMVTSIRGGAVPQTTKPFLLAAPAQEGLALNRVSQHKWPGDRRGRRARRGCGPFRSSLGAVGRETTSTRPGETPGEANVVLTRCLSC